MLKGAIICPDRDLADLLIAEVLETHRIAIVRRLEAYPTAVNLARFLRAAAPELLFLSIETRQVAMDIVKIIQADSPATQIVALSRTCDPPTLLETMRAGIREFLSPPFELEALMATINRIDELVQHNPPQFEATDSVYAFLPAKAGSGATTIAVNTALALSRMSDTNTLLADLDLNSGLVGFMLLLKNASRSIVDAAENALELDENLWPKLVSTKDHLDVLPAGKLAPGLRIEPTQIRHILAYARRHYGAICVDLSGMMERYSVELMHEAKRIYLVTTSEIPALHLAREKLSFLRSEDLGEKVSILLNRSQKRPQISLEDTEKLLGAPVHMSFPNDYDGVHKALTAGKEVEANSPLGICIRELADTMIRRTAAIEKHVVVVEKKRGLMDILTRRSNGSIVTPG
jgi:pilus assembly protein CpaE